MTTNSNLITSHGGSTPLSTIFNSSKNIPLFKKVDETFWLYLTYFITTVSYCAYNLYKAYQFSHHISFGLGDGFKLVKCQALLGEIKAKVEGSEEIPPLLQQCESLLASIGNDDKYKHYEKNEFLTSLALYYAINRPEDACRIAEKISSSHDLLKIAQRIQNKHPNCDHLEALFIRAFKTYIPSPKIHLYDLRYVLQFPKIFRSFKNNELADQSSAQVARFIDYFENPLLRLRAWCEVAQSYPEKDETSISSAQTLLKNLVSPVDLIHAHLALANAFLSLGKYQKMDEELEQINTLFNNSDPLTTRAALYSWANFIKKISENNEIISQFKNAKVEPLIEKVFEAVFSDSEKLTVEQRIEAYPRIVSTYQECLNNSAKANLALDRALEEINTLPDKTGEEIESKVIELTGLLLFEKTITRDRAINILQILEGLYDRYPVDNQSISHKISLGASILRFYNKNGLSCSSDKFFEKHLSSLIAMNTDVLNKISRLISYVDSLHGLDGYSLTKQQMRTLFETAEGLLPRLPSFHHKLAIRWLAKAYLPIDRSKALELIENYENRQVRGHLITAAVAAIAAVAFPRFPQETIFLSFCGVITRILFH